MNLTPEKIELLKRTKPLDRATALGLIPESTFRKFAHQCRSEESAHAEVLPGPLADAFDSDGNIVVGEYKIRRFVASDWSLLKKVNSPIYRQTVESKEMIEAAATGKLADFKGRDIDVTDEEAYDLCYIFTHTPSECRKAVAKGLESFRETVMSEFADKCHPLLVPKIAAAVCEQARIAFSTALKYESANDEDSKKNRSPGQAV